LGLQSRAKEQQCNSAENCSDKPIADHFFLPYSSLGQASSKIRPRLLTFGAMVRPS
jgi:hypothetical protein